MNSNYTISHVKNFEKFITLLEEKRVGTLFRG